MCKPWFQQVNLQEFIITKEKGEKRIFTLQGPGYHHLNPESKERQQ